MKLLFLATGFLCFINHNNPTEDMLAISKLVHAFSKNADDRNVSEMDLILHQDFRAVVNQAFGSTEVQLMDKSSYLDLMRKEVIGGDDRTVHILSIDLQEKNAVVKARFAGKALVFTTFIQVVKNSAGKWEIISDLPEIQKAE